MKWICAGVGLLAVMLMAAASQAADLSPVERGEKAYPNKAAWIAALIADLDQVDAQQMEPRGGIFLGMEPDVRALIACGDEAVGPLVDCMEQDDRFTKSVYFPMNLSTDRHVLRVSEVAYYAASAILKVSFFTPKATADVLSSRNAEDRKRVFDAVQAYWNKYKSLPIEERWFQTLADDQAGTDDWLQAMGNIARPVDDQLEFQISWREKWKTIRDSSGGPRWKLSGEVLRLKSNPSVTSLAARRIEQIDQLSASSPDRVAETYPAVHMAVELSRWDPAGCKAAVEKQFQYCIVLNSTKRIRNHERVALFIADLAGALGNAGDQAGLKTYYEFLRSMNFTRTETDPTDLLAPLFKFRDDPLIAAASDWLFNDPASAWNPIVPKISAGFQGDEVIRSPLLGVRSFRAQIERGLTDQTPFVDQTTITSRMCDRYAQAISKISGAPDFQMNWTEVLRDNAIPAFRAFLDRYGDRLGAAPPNIDDDHGLVPMAYLIFPHSDQCASQQQVESAAAIFSLDGQGERRQYKLSSLPVKGKWVTLKKYEHDEQSYDYTAKKPIVEHRFEQDCWVWQAEEVKINGQWQRYFGVVGPHEVAKVPAGEIELPGKWPWSGLSDGIDFRAEEPGTRPAHGDYFNHATLGMPLIMRMYLRNRRGIAQALPAELGGKDANGRLVFRAGVTMTLKRYGVRPDSAPAVDIPMKPLPLLNSDTTAKQKIVETADEIPVGDFDLRDCFDINQPGQYNLQFRFTKPGGFAEGGTNFVIFKLEEPQ